MDFQTASISKVKAAASRFSYLSRISKIFGRSMVVGPGILEHQVDVVDKPPRTVVFSLLQFAFYGRQIHRLLNDVPIILKKNKPQQTLHIKYSKRNQSTDGIFQKFRKKLQQLHNKQLEIFHVAIYYHVKIYKVQLNVTKYTAHALNIGIYIVPLPALTTWH